MQFLPDPLKRLIAELSKLPSIGNKSAARLAYHFVNNPELASNISESLKDSAEQIRKCKHCFFVCDQDACKICEDTSRDQNIICIVEKAADLIAIEEAGVYKGQYHVLNALWAPLRGQGTDALNLDHLLSRIQEKAITEVIIATGSTVEGDATALYLARMLSEKGIKTTRLAQGLPKGGDLEYLDDVTLSRALSGRTEV